MSSWRDAVRWRYSPFRGLLVVCEPGIFIVCYNGRVVCFTFQSAMARSPTDLWDALTLVFFVDARRIGLTDTSV